MPSSFEQFLASRARLNSLLGTPGDAEAQFIRVSPAGSAGETPALVNAGGDAVITNKGVTVVNGAITVTNAGSVVVIDGTSDIFKIQTTGTLSVTYDGTVRMTMGTVILSGLGMMTECPMILSMGQGFSSENGSRDLMPLFWMADIPDVGTVGAMFETTGDLPTNPGLLNIHLTVYLYLSYTPQGPAVMRYYVLKEAAL